MTIISLILFFTAGLLIWFLYFYVQFWKKDIINNLRSENNELKNENSQLKQEKEEADAQNKLLKESIQDYQQKNSYLKSVVSELSTYQHAVKEASKISIQLQQQLAIYDPSIKDKVKYALEQDQDDYSDVNNFNETKTNEDSSKKFF